MPIKKDGKEYLVKGKKIVLYPISKMSEQLTLFGFPRTTQTLRKWEVNGTLPPAVFKKKGIRLYTMDQIRIVCKLAKEFNIRQGHFESNDEFSKEVKKQILEWNRKFFGLDETAEK